MIEQIVHQALCFQPAVWMQALQVALFGNSYTTILVNNYFISLHQDNIKLFCADACYDAKQSDYLCAQDPLLLKNKIVIGRLVSTKSELKKNDEDFNRLYQTAQNLIIRLEVSEIYLALCSIYDHLKMRTSDQKMITQHGAVQELLGKTVEQISILKIFIQNNSNQPDDYDPCFIQYAKKATVAICLDLAKLQGGKGFLYGGMGEMLWFFQMVHAVYLPASLI